jgi:DNA-binding NtrC family response regulator
MLKMQEKPRILIVDDELIMRESLTAWLEDEGFAPVAVDSGLAALEILGKEKVDVAVVDIKMPGMDGITLLRKMKDNNIDVPVLMITAHATVESAVQSMKDGAYDYIMKPFPPEKLTYIIRRVTEHRQVVAENIRLQKERKQFLRIAIGVVINLIIFAVIFYFVFK